jgi:hypothetical protein
VVKILKKLKTLISILVVQILVLALVQNTAAQTPSEMEIFFSNDYAGISIEFNATRETVPGENITINLWINCTADGVNVDYLTLSVYGFRYGQEKTEPPLLSTYVIEKPSSLVLNHTYQYNYTVYIPNDVWGRTYAELYIQYTVVEPTPLKRNPTFWITIVKNVYFEELENKFKNLNYTYWQLNETFWKSFQMNLTEENLDILNQTYWELQQNYTSSQGRLGELENTRWALIILAITTVFFVATTIYMIMRKPKQYW